MLEWLTKVLPWGKGREVEGQYRPGPYFVSDGQNNGWISADVGRYWNWWQTGYRPQAGGAPSAMVEACVSAYSQTVAMCPGDHWRRLDNGGRERVTTSALQRIIKAPNDYQSISDFLLNLVRRLYERGEAFAVAERNNRFEITALHLMRAGVPQIAEDGSIFYSLWGNEVVQQRLALTIPVPARDVLHVRLQTPVHPLRGVSPILAATLDLAMSGAALTQQIAFYLNQARPSFTLQTDAPMKRPEAELLRDWWDSYTSGENAGKTPILMNGLKATPIATSAVDAQLAEMRKLNDEHIALVHRIPLAVLGVGGGTTYSSTEQLMQAWKANGLGFTLNHIEEAFGLMFGLKGQPDEYLEFDTQALLRSAYRERIEALARGVMSSIYSPDEARAEMELPAVEGGYGKQPRVQQQVVPLSYGAELQPPSPSPTLALPPPSGPQDPQGGQDTQGEPQDAADQQQENAAFRSALRGAYERHRLAA